MAYIDVDPVVISHAQGLLGKDSGVRVVSGDLRESAGIPDHPDLRHTSICASRPRALFRTGHAIHELQSPRPAGRRYPGPLNAGLRGNGLVVDDLYLLAHDDRTGKPLLPPRPTTGSGRGILRRLRGGHR